MTKFHINKHGVPAPCRAKKGNCPLGGAEQHYNSEQEAADAIKKEFESKHSLLPDVSGDKMPPRKARAEFKMSKTELESYKGKTVEVDYDIDKSFSGEVIGVHYNSDGDSGIIIESDNGEIKHIKNYRMDDLAVVSINKLDKYNNHVKEKIKDFKNSIKHHDFPGDLIVPLERDMNDDADEYLEAVIKEYETGEKMDEDTSDEFIYLDYKEQVQDQIDEYEREINEYESSFTDESNEDFYNDEYNAEKQTKVFHKQRELINQFAKDAEEFSIRQPELKTPEQKRLNTAKILRSILDKGEYKI